MLMPLLTCQLIGGSDMYVPVCRRCFFAPLEELGVSSANRSASKRAHSSFDVDSNMSHEGGERENRGEGGTSSPTGSMTVCSPTSDEDVQLAHKKLKSDHEPETGADEILSTPKAAAFTTGSRRISGIF